MPRALDVDLADMFRNELPEIYYSLWSADPVKHHLMFPAALPPPEALRRLRAWQKHSGKVVRIHLALIEGYNDQFDDLARIMHAVLGADLKVDYNLVRYNPPNTSSRAASDSAYKRARLFLNAKQIERVGYDVHASCGMFYDAREAA